MVKLAYIFLLLFLCEGFGEDCAQISDQNAHLTDELNETLGNQDHSVVLAFGRSLNDHVDKVVNDAVEGLFILEDFL